MNKRFEELDSLRGVAAIIVLLSHTLFMFSTVEQEIKASIPFLSFLWNGHSAVVLFFILSGFVLTLPFEKSKKISYTKYITKRYCRIYLPYLMVFLSLIIIKISLESKVGSITNLQQWALWAKEVSVRSLFDHFFFLGEYDSDAFLMVVWSLVHEMRISLVFPFVAILLFRISWKWSLSIAGLSSIGAFILMKMIPTQFGLAISTNYFITFHYLSMFIVGSVIARNRSIIIKWASHSKMLYSLAILSFLLFNYPHVPYMVIGKLFSNIDYLLYQISIDWIITIGGAGIVILSLSSIQFSKMLLLKPVNYLGKISYSIYLIHPVVLISFAHAFYGIIPIWLILIMAFVSSIIIADLSYKFIEKPSIRLGGYLTKTQNVKQQSKEISA